MHEISANVFINEGYHARINNVSAVCVYWIPNRKGVISPRNIDIDIPIIELKKTDKTIKCLTFVIYNLLFLNAIFDNDGYNAKTPAYIIIWNGLITFFSCAIKSNFKNVTSLCQNN